MLIGSYVPWLSRFVRYIDGKKEYGKILKDSIENGPYQMKEIEDQGNSNGNPRVPPFKRIQEEAYHMGNDKKQFEADIDAMNAVLLGILNDIYNSVDVWQTARAIWQQLKQNEKNANTSRAKRAARTHDPFTLVVNHSAAPSPYHTSSPYYVTYPSSVVNFDAETQSFEFQ
ncbi:hypothetical protein Tco_1465957 [Tanacetum coccineum]